MDNVKQLLRGMQSHTVVGLMTQCYFQTSPSTAWPWSCKEVQICPWVLPSYELFAVLPFICCSVLPWRNRLVGQPNGVGTETWGGRVDRVLLIPGSRRSPGGGNGNSLRCSCLENPMDKGAWWATVQGLAKSQNPFWEQRRLVQEWRRPV